MDHNVIQWHKTASEIFSFPVTKFRPFLKTESLTKSKALFLSLCWKLYLERNFLCLKWFRRQHEIYSTLWRCFFWTLSRLNRNFYTSNFCDLRWPSQNLSTISSTWHFLSKNGSTWPWTWIFSSRIGDHWPAWWRFLWLLFSLKLI